MGTLWSDALRRAATVLGRRRRVAEGEESELTDESGFTLIELMVVLLIMGILMAIAIPTFLGATNTANDTSTQSNLANVITSAKAIYAKGDTYPKTATMASQLQGSEPEFTFTAVKTSKTVPLTKSTTQKQIAIATGTTTGTDFIAVAYMTKTHVCWVAKDVANGATAGVQYGYLKATVGKATGKTGCTTTAAIAATAVTFQTKWPTAPAGD